MVLAGLALIVPSSAAQVKAAGTGPVITAISPASGHHAGGTSVAITGGRFLGATSVRFGKASAAFAVVSGNKITASRPPGPAGTGPVTVTTPAGRATTPVI